MQPTTQYMGDGTVPFQGIPHGNYTVQNIERIEEGFEDIEEQITEYRKLLQEDFYNDVFRNELSQIYSQSANNYKENQMLWKEIGRACPHKAVFYFKIFYSIWVNHCLNQEQLITETGLENLIEDFRDYVFGTENNKIMFAEEKESFVDVIKSETKVFKEVAKLKARNNYEVSKTSITIVDTQWLSQRLICTINFSDQKTNESKHSYNIEEKREKKREKRYNEAASGSDKGIFKIIKKYSLIDHKVGKIKITNIYQQENEKFTLETITINQDQGFKFNLSVNNYGDPISVIKTEKEIAKDQDELILKVNKEVSKEHTIKINNFKIEINF